MNKEYFFISKPRCASTHIYEGLTNWDDKINGWKPFYHITASEMRNCFDNYDSCFSFSVIRNPYDLVCSWYKEHRKERYEKEVIDFYGCSFEEWLKRGCPTHWNHFKYNPLEQNRWVYENDKLIVSYLIRLEEYDKDIKYVYEKIRSSLSEDISIETIGKKRRNETNNKIELTENQKEIIYGLFKKDFKYFGYEK